MAVDWRITTTLANDMADEINDAVNGGAGAAVLKLYKTVAMPAGPATAATAEDLLVEITLNDPAFTTSNGVCTLDVDPALTANATGTGTAVYGRICISTNAGEGNEAAAGVIDGNVGTSEAAINLNTTSIASGSPVTITSGTITVPTGSE